MDLAAATSAWVQTLGADRVAGGDAVRACNARGTYPLGTGCALCLSPADVAQAAACLRIASRFRVPLHPVSRGCNWGYGSRHPARDGGALLDLSGLACIRQLDQTLGTVTVEPGVTWGQLEEALAGTGWFLSTPGTRPDASVLANTAQRGIGAGRVPQRCAALIGLEVLLASGEIVTTGGGALAGSRAAAVDPHGEGPDITGLFVQSRLGVLTAGTLALERRPAAHRMLRVGIRAPGDLALLVDTLRELRQQEVLQASVGLFNDYRLMAYQGRYPWAEAAGQTPLPEPLLRSARDGWGGFCWVAETELLAPGAACLDDLVALANAAFEGTALQACWGPDGELGPVLCPASAEGLPVAWWRKRSDPPLALDPDGDAVGLVWHGVIVPARGALVDEVVQCMSAVLRAAHLEPNLSLQLLDGRRVLALAQLSWDREQPGQDAAAMAALTTLTRDLAERGWWPYRRPQGSPSLPRAGATRALLDGLHHLLDPHGIL